MMYDVPAGDVVMIAPERGSIRTALGYDPADPYAITMVFNAGTDEEKRWLVGRDLLAAGLKSSAGDGDVRFFRGASHDLLYIVLFPRQKARQVKFTARAPDFSEFLDATYAIVPAGSEVIDMDSELDWLLSEDE